MSGELELITDGAARDNQHAHRRRAGIGYLIVDESDILTEGSEFLGQGEKYTNNFAEYRAAERGVEAIISNHRPEDIDLLLMSDSELMVKQLRDEWDANDDTLQRLRGRLMDSLQGFNSWSVSHRSEPDDDRIERADALAGRAIETELD
jgi:ribonuclease HI